MHALASLTIKIYEDMRAKGHGKLVSKIAAATLPAAFFGTFMYGWYATVYPGEGTHKHQTIKIERTFYDNDNDGKYEQGITSIKFKDGCVQTEVIPLYAIGGTRKDYEKIFGRLDSMDSLNEIEEILTFRQNAEMPNAP